MILTPPIAQFALWFRPRSRQPWQLIAIDESSQALVDRAAELPSGDVTTLPVGEDPNRQWPRIPG